MHQALAVQTMNPHVCPTADGAYQKNHLNARKNLVPYYHKTQTCVQTTPSGPTGHVTTRHMERARDVTVVTQACVYSHNHRMGMCGDLVLTKVTRSTASTQPALSSR